MYFQNYFFLFLFASFSISLSALIFLISMFVTSRSDDIEKLSAYECGFSPFDDSRLEFDVKFYLIAILFLVFDLEISFLFPFLVSFDTNSAVSICSLFFFLFLLLIGFYYEWKKGALDWS